MNLKLALAAALVIAGTAAQAETIINFDDLTGYNPVPDFYQGVHWNGFVSYDSEQSPYTAHSGNTRVFGSYDVYGMGTGPITFDVGAGSIFDGFWAAGAGTELSYAVYSGGVLLATSATLTLTDTPTFLASGYAGAIDEVRITTPNGFWVGDDFSFSVLSPLGAVPEPASWALMLTGFGFAGSALRRRRAVLAA